MLTKKINVFGFEIEIQPNAWVVVLEKAENHSDLVYQKGISQSGNQYSHPIFPMEQYGIPVDEFIVGFKKIIKVNQKDLKFFDFLIHSDKDAIVINAKKTSEDIVAIEKISQSDGTTGEFLNTVERYGKTPDEFIREFINQSYWAWEDANGKKSSRPINFEL